MSRRDRVLVTGVGGPAGRALSRNLSSRGFDVIGVDMAPVKGLRSATMTVPAADDPRFARALCELARATAADLVIPTVSEELPVLAELAASGALLPAAIVVPQAPAVRLADDKWYTCRELSSHGVAVPRFALASELTSAERAARRLGWPFLSKPRRARGGRGVRIHARPEDALPRDRGLTLLQEFAPGTEFAVELYIGDRLRDDVVVVLEKTELAQGAVGNATAVRRVFAPRVARLALDGARAAGLSGPADVDIRLALDGTPLVLELNARFGAHCEYAPETIDALLAERAAPIARAA